MTDLSKAIQGLENELIKAKKMPIGTVSKGRKKISEGKWVPVEKEKKEKMDGKIKKLEKEIIDMIDDKNIKILREDRYTGKKEIVSELPKSILLEKDDPMHDIKNGYTVTTLASFYIRSDKKKLEKKRDLLFDLKHPKIAAKYKKQ